MTSSEPVRSPPLKLGDVTLTWEQLMTLKALRRLEQARSNVEGCLLSTLQVNHEYRRCVSREHKSDSHARSMASTHQRLRRLAGRGFVQMYHYGLTALWRLGPMADKLEEMGAL